MKMVIITGPHADEHQILFFEEGSVEADNVYTVEEYEDLVDTILNVMEIHNNVSTVNILGPTVWANNLIKQLKGKDIEDYSTETIEYALI